MKNIFKYSLLLAIAFVLVQCKKEVTPEVGGEVGGEVGPVVEVGVDRPEVQAYSYLAGEYTSYDRCTVHSAGHSHPPGTSYDTIDVTIRRNIAAINSFIIENLVECDTVNIQIDEEGIEIISRTNNCGYWTDQFRFTLVGKDTITYYEMHNYGAGARGLRGTLIKK